MDGDKLHRAEIVPVNINGYVPTPATGRFRTAILHRLARISRPLGTCMRNNGVHAVVARCAGHTTTDWQIVDTGGVEPKTVPVHLDAMGLTPLSPALFKAPNRRYRLGTDILARGDSPLAPESYCGRSEFAVQVLAMLTGRVGDVAFP